MQLSFSIQKLFASYTKVRGAITIEKQDFETKKIKNVTWGHFVYKLVYSFFWSKYYIELSFNIH